MRLETRMYERRWIQLTLLTGLLWFLVGIAWAPSKNLSLTLAYVDLGRIVPGVTNNRKQKGAYLSAQVAF